MEPSTLSAAQDGSPSTAPTRCPLTAAMNAIGGKWSMICLYWLASGNRRFNELQRLMPEISHKVLAQTLRGLEEEGLIVHIERPGPSTQFEYGMSTHGASLQPLIEAVRQWGRAHIEWKGD
jgi:DNA-binding HxlR family transcriptional regulator